MKTWLGRILLLMLGMLIAAIVLEAGLQIAGVVARRIGDRASLDADAEPSASTVLCVGDSHTYGSRRHARQLWRQASRWLGTQGRTPSEANAVTRRDLERIATLLKEHGIGWILVTYPQPGRKDSVDEAILRFARDRRIPIVRTEQDLAVAQIIHPDAQGICPANVPEGQKCLLIDAMGPHPSDLLYALIAESIGKKVLPLLATRADSRQ